MKNANITSFFKPVPRSSQNSEPVTQNLSPPPKPPSSPQPLRLRSSRSLSPRPRSAESQSSRARSPIASLTRLPSKSPSPFHSPDSRSTPNRGPPEPQVRARDAVIPGSDDEDGDILSDDDFPDLFTIRRPAPTPPKGDGITCFTPKAKRVASATFMSSPLTINSKKKHSLGVGPGSIPPPDFSMGQNLRAYLSDTDSPSSPSLPGSPQTERNVHLDIIPTGTGSDEEGRTLKIQRAIERTEATSSRRQWSFFESGGRGGESVATKRPFPKQSANKIWAFLAAAKTRSLYFQSGIVHDLQLRTPASPLPDEIFLWVLNEIPFESSTVLRNAYIKLVGECSKQVFRFLDEGAIDSLFMAIGASEAAVDPKAKIPHSVRVTCMAETQLAKLESILELFSAASESMNKNALDYAVLLLLRLGNDRVVRNECTARHNLSNALRDLANAVPSNHWTTLCEKTCALLNQAIEDVVFRSDTLLMIPTTSRRLLDLRRRLALVFLFDDPQRGGSDPAAIFSILAIQERLKGPDFVVDHRTDYPELVALVSILDMAIDNGCSPTDANSSEAIKNIDDELDGLARSIKLMYSVINTGQFVSRHEARAALANLEKRLIYVVRSRPPPRDGIFCTRTDPADADRPRQQEFMKKFFQKPSN